MDSGLLTWLGESMKLFSGLLFIQPASLLVFVQIGMLVTILGLSQFFTIRDGINDFEQKIAARAFHPSPNQIVLLQQKRNFVQMLNVVTACGVFYFAAIPILLYLMTYRIPSSTGSVQISRSFVFLTNFSFVLILVPSSCIAIHYIRYRLRIFRLH
jgi:hypothetical protein